MIKRDGKSEPVAFDKITARIKKLCYGFDPKHVDAVELNPLIARGLTMGDEIAAVTTAADGSFGQGLFTVVGTYRSGDLVMDRYGAYLHLEDAQALLSLYDQVHQLTVVTDDADTIADYAVALREAVGGDEVEVQTWWEADPQSQEMMNLRDVGSAIMLFIVFGAAGFGILNTMMMSVFERTQELGVLRALGIRGGRLVSLIVVESVFLAGVAAVLGLIVGGGLDAYLVVYGFDMSASAQDFSFNGVAIDPVIKGIVRWESVLFVVVALFIVSALASLWPAWRAASLRPVEAIRSE